MSGKCCVVCLRLFESKGAGLMRNGVSREIWCWLFLEALGF